MPYLTYHDVYSHVTTK